MFSWPSLFVILCENTWKMQRSRAWENYRKTVRKTSCTLAFSWSRKTINKMKRSCTQENFRETFKKTGYSLAFSWCRVTCDELRVFLAFYWGWTVNLPSVFRYQKTLVWCRVFQSFTISETNDEQGFLCREVNSKENKPKGQVIESQFSTVSPLESVDDVWSSILFPWQPYDSPKNCSPPSP